MTGLTDDFWKQSLVPQQTPTPDVVGRMEALEAFVRAVTTNYCASVPYELLKRAQDLLPVDPIEAIVDELMLKDCTTRQAITEAVYRGRALERGEA